MNNREKFIVEKFSLSEEDVLKISEISEKLLKTNKYTVWLARETKKEQSILNQQEEIFTIVEWIIKTKGDIMKYSFLDALKEIESWKKEQGEFKKIKENIEKGEIDKNRIIFINEEGDHFFYLLEVGDLKYEATKMDNCLNDSSSYSNKIKKSESFIVSLRNEDNIPCVTIEIDIKTKKAKQVLARGNQKLSRKLNGILSEFVLFLSGIKNQKDQKILEIINSNLKFFDLN